MISWPRGCQGSSVCSPQNDLGHSAEHWKERSLQQGPPGPSRQGGHGVADPGQFPEPSLPSRVRLGRFLPLVELLFPNLFDEHDSVHFPR